MFIDKEIKNITYDSGVTGRLKKSNLYKYTNPPGLKKHINDWRFKKSYIGNTKTPIKASKEVYLCKLKFFNCGILFISVITGTTIADGRSYQES